MTVGLTICPECRVPYDTNERRSSEHSSIQALEQECPECGNEEIVGIVNYPTRYEVIGPSIEGDICDYRVKNPDTRFSLTRCGEDADWRFHAIGDIVKGRCDEHLESHRRDALTELF